MKKIFFMALAAIALGACNSEPKFKVEGEDVYKRQVQNPGYVFFRH